MELGWVKLHRKLLNNDELFGSSLTLGVFVYLLLRANKEGKVDIGRFQLAERFRAKPSTIYQTLKRLECNNQITLKSNNKFTKVTICNWSKYQGRVTPEKGEMQQQSNTKQEGKNKENIIIINNNNMVATQTNYGNEEINKLWAYFEEQISPITSKQKMNRYALANLHKQHGTEKVQALIRAASFASEDRYGPVIVNPMDLQEKLPRLVAWVKKNKQKGITSV